MSILSGFFKTKKLRRMADGNYKLQSEWTSSETVEMADGNTVEENLGSIKGITSSLASTDSGYALAADAGKNLQDQVNELNSNLAVRQAPNQITNVFESVSTNSCLVSTFVKRIILNGTITAVADKYVKIGTIPYPPFNSVLKSINLNLADNGWLSINEVGEIAIMARRSGSMNIYIDETLI